MVAEADALPDSEEVVVRYLTEALDEVATVGLIVPPGDDISSLLPFVRVARRGGPGDHRARIDFPVIDIDVWDTTNARANAIGGLVRGLVAAMRWHRDDVAHAIVTRVEESAGPQRLPEEVPQLVRIGFSVGLTVRSLPGG
jgi:hypothetical protein